MSYSKLGVKSWTAYLEVGVIAAVLLVGLVAYVVARVF